MSLKKLKSIFSDTEKFQISDLTKLNSRLDNVDDLTSTRTIFGNSPEKVGRDVNLSSYTPDKISLFPPEHSTALNFNPRISANKNFLFANTLSSDVRSIVDVGGQNVISFKKTNLSELESFSSAGLDKIIPYEKNTFNKDIDFTPLTDNDLVDKTFTNAYGHSANPLLKSIDFTPLTDNDEISKFDIIDFLPLTMAGHTDKLSKSNLDDISAVSPFQNKHFFGFGDNFTKKWSTTNNLGVNESFGNIGDSEFVQKDLSISNLIESIPTQYHSIPLKAEHGGPAGNGIVTLNTPEYHIEKNTINLTNGHQLTNTSKIGEGDLVFETLYNNDGTATENKSGNFLLRNNELLVSHDILDPSDIQPSSIFNPKSRIADDEERIGKFLGSQAGEDFVNRQLGMGAWQKYHSLFDKASIINMVGRPSEGYLDTFNPINRNQGLMGFTDDIIQFFGGNAVDPSYSEYLDQRGKLGDDQKTYAEYDTEHRPLAYDTANTLNAFADIVIDAVSEIGRDIVDNIVTGTTDGAGPADLKIKKEKAGITTDSKIDSVNNVNRDISPSSKPLGNLGKGDVATLQPIKKYTGDFTNDKEYFGNGMPFYFRDLRDNRIITFRAYIDGISDTVSPSWSSTSYIGRSEPVYTYTGGEREISFNLKLFANTKDELNRIYEKINRLTSMCYPEYKPYETPDTTSIVTVDLGPILGTGNKSSKERMKPPLAKLRLGDLFGNQKKEMTGFIKSLSYSFPDNSPWEIEPKKQVPKLIEISFSWQVIHSTVPSLSFTESDSHDAFYGITQELMEGGIV